MMVKSLNSKQDLIKLALMNTFREEFSSLQAENSAFRQERQVLMTELSALRAYQAAFYAVQPYLLPELWERALAQAQVQPQIPAQQSVQNQTQSQQPTQTILASGQVQVQAQPAGVVHIATQSAAQQSAAQNIEANPSIAGHSGLNPHDLVAALGCLTPAQAAAFAAAAASQHQQQQQHHMHQFQPIHQHQDQQQQRHLHHLQQHQQNIQQHQQNIQQHQQNIQQQQQQQQLKNIHLSQQVQLQQQPPVPGIVGGAQVSSHISAGSKQTVDLLIDNQSSVPVSVPSASLVPTMSVSAGNTTSALESAIASALLAHLPAGISLSSSTCPATTTTTSISSTHAIGLDLTGIRHSSACNSDISTHQSLQPPLLPRPSVPLLSNSILLSPPAPRHLSSTSAPPPLPVTPPLMNLFSNTINSAQPPTLPPVSAINTAPCLQPASCPAHSENHT
ncbi:unnamed protein product [Protopolystoma xenopodis]|uniref:Uncharacterized protein n=1 Tax=Protopolystoma xenopodis TaxID=117903 RepID=A0A448WZ61_9PLAT|nr:unnamed protein product [Protopolystoma xenopodis]